MPSCPPLKISKILQRFAFPFGFHSLPVYGIALLSHVFSVCGVPGVLGEFRGVQLSSINFEVLQNMKKIVSWNSVRVAPNSQQFEVQVGVFYWGQVRLRL